MPLPIAPNQHPLVDKATGLATLPWIMFFTALQSSGGGGGGPAPGDAEYLVGAPAAGLTSARVVTNSNSNVWNLAVAGQASVSRVALSGDITAAFDSNVTALSTTGVTPGTYGDSTHVGQFTVDAKGRLTFAANVALTASGTQYMPVFVGGIAVTSGDVLIAIPWEPPS